ncbi:uncharacterized protein ACOB8E_001976 [Sarcophilus harrisii]
MESVPLCSHDPPPPPPLMCLPMPALPSSIRTSHVTGDATGNAQGVRMAVSMDAVFIVTMLFVSARPRRLARRRGRLRPQGGGPRAVTDGAPQDPRGARFRRSPLQEPVFRTVSVPPRFPGSKRPKPCSSSRPASPVTALHRDDQIRRKGTRKSKTQRRTSHSGGSALAPTGLSGCTRLSPSQSMGAAWITSWLPRAASVRTARSVALLLPCATAPGPARFPRHQSAPVSRALGHPPLVASHRAAELHDVLIPRFIQPLPSDGRPLSVQFLPPQTVRHMRAPFPSS